MRRGGAALRAAALPRRPHVPRHAPAAARPRGAEGARCSRPRARAPAAAAAPRHSSSAAPASASRAIAAARSVTPMLLSVKALQEPAVRVGGAGGRGPRGGCRRPVQRLARRGPQPPVTARKRGLMRLYMCLTPHDHPLRGRGARGGNDPAAAVRSSPLALRVRPGSAPNECVGYRRPIRGMPDWARDEPGREAQRAAARTRASCRRRRSACLLTVRGRACCATCARAAMRPRRGQHTRTHMAAPPAGPHQPRAPARR